MREILTLKINKLFKNLLYFIQDPELTNAIFTFYETCNEMFMILLLSFTKSFFYLLAIDLGMTTGIKIISIKLCSCTL